MAMAQGRAQPANFQEWVDSQPKTIRDDVLWSAHFYQKALFLYDLCWADCEPWMRDARGRAIAEQIIRSCGSIAANIEEGYGRGFGRDYARFLVIATGSARETRGWYVRARH
jgi:four helix bundle protein